MKCSIRHMRQRSGEGNWSRQQQLLLLSLYTPFYFVYHTLLRLSPHQWVGAKTRSAVQRKLSIHTGRKWGFTNMKSSSPHSGPQVFGLWHNSEFASAHHQSRFGAKQSTHDLNVDFYLLFGWFFFLSFFRKYSMAKLKQIINIRTARRMFLPTSKYYELNNL